MILYNVNFVFDTNLLGLDEKQVSKLTDKFLEEFMTNDNSPSKGMSFDDLNKLLNLNARKFYVKSIQYPAIENIDENKILIKDILIELTF